MSDYEFTARLWEWDGKASWYFVTLPHGVADDIDERVSSRRGFGSVRVEVAVGETTWRTSVFPSTSEESFVLPIKKAVRQAEGIDEDDDIAVGLSILDSRHSWRTVAARDVEEVTT